MTVFGLCVRLLSCPILALVLLLIPASLFAWGREGHEIIAMIAEPRLQPDVRGAVATLLEGTTFIEAANWADQVRTRQTGPWHYVNIEITDTEYDAARDCPKDQCVIAQIERFRHVLTNEAANERKRQKALKYLIHFVGDLHQPLHAANNHDHGGNDVEVEFLDQKINSYSNKPWNLHAVWDSGILGKSIAWLNRRDPDARQYADRLNVWLNKQPAGAFLGGSVVDWAMESHRLAIDNVYLYDVIPENLKLGVGYYRASYPIVDQQLAKAGVRLAKVLNDALGKKQERGVSAGEEPSVTTKQCEVR